MDLLTLKHSYEYLCSALQNEDADGVKSILQLEDSIVENSETEPSFLDFLWTTEQSWSSQSQIPVRLCHQILFDLTEDEGFLPAWLCFPFETTTTTIDQDDAAGVHLEPQDILDLKRQIAVWFLLHNSINNLQLSCRVPSCFVQSTQNVRLRRSKLRMNDNDDLDIVILVATDLWTTTNRFPKYNDCSEQIVQLDNDDDDEILQVFVSHVWRSQSHPDAKGEDFRELREILRSTIEGSLLLYRSLITLGCDATEIGQNDDNFSSASLSDLEISHRFIQRVYGIVCQAFVTGEKSNEEAFRYVTDRIHLWIDWTSLPQKDRTAEEDIWFRESLQNLGSIQRQMETIALGKCNNYLSRAWCLAELLNASTYVTTFGIGSFPCNTVLGICFRVMIGTGALRHLDVLEALHVSITNGKDDSATVCRILWSCSASHILFFRSIAFCFYERNANRTIRTRGRRKHVAQYFQEIAAYRHSTPSFDWWVEWRNRFLHDREKEAANATQTCRRFCFLAEGSHSVQEIYGAYGSFLASSVEDQDSYVQCDVCCPEDEVSGYTDVDATVETVAFQSSVWASTAHTTLRKHQPFALDGQLRLLRETANRTLR